MDQDECWTWRLKPVQKDKDDKLDNSLILHIFFVYMFAKFLP